MKKHTVFIALLSWAVAGFGQNYLDVLRPFNGMGGRSGAESGATPAALGASNALTGNPAQLSYVEKAVFSFDLSYNNVQGRSIFNNQAWDNVDDQQLKLNSLSYIHPVRVYRGSWVWGVNIHPVADYSSFSQFVDLEPDGDFEYRRSAKEEGSLFAFTLGTAFLASPNTSLGFSLSILNGHNEASKVYAESDDLDLYTFTEYLDSLHFSPDYGGFGVRMGVSHALSEVLQLAASVEFPSRISVSESSSLNQIEWFDDGTRQVHESQERSTLKYAIWGPWRVGVGLGFINKPLSASINYRFHSYGGISFSGDLVDPTTGNDLAGIIDDEVNEYVDNVNEFSASLQWELEPLTLSFGGSFMNDPLSYHFDDILRLDLGLGYTLSSGLGFTMAFRNEQWQGDLNHSLENDTDRIVEVENTLSQFQFGLKYIF